MIPQHQLLGLRLQIHLLVHSLRYWIAVVAIPSYRTEHNRQTGFNLTARMPVEASTAVNRIPARKGGTAEKRRHS
jgi:hypothetical protein